MGKEKIMKIKNKQMENQLNIQAQTFDKLVDDEGLIIKNVVANHKAKIKALKQWTENAKEAIISEQDQLQLDESMKGDAILDREKAARKEEAAHTAMIQTLKSETEQKVKQIIADASKA